MASHVRACLCGGALILLFARPGAAGTLQIDLPAALARARDRAPDAIASRARAGEVRALRAGATAWMSQNPRLEVGAGPRSGPDRTLVIQGQLSVPIELSTRRVQLAVADAQLAHANATTEAELREVGLAVTTAFYEARFADLAIELAVRNQDVATRAAEAAARRRKAGDLTDLEVNLATIALGRARAAVASERANRAEAIGRLGLLIAAGPDDALELVGDLSPLPVTLDTLRAAVGTRPDLRAIDAEASEARAESAVAAVTGRPDVTTWVSYERDEGDTILLGGLSFTLPVWNRNVAARAAARAKLARTGLERSSRTAAASRQVGDAFEGYTRAREAVEIFTRDVLPALADSEQLLERSIETGQLPINVYLVARQEILAGRREHLERRLQLAKAAAAARFAAGVAP
ncbi:MAG: TolC family protein [Kofleriaceae bacterium]